MEEMTQCALADREVFQRVWQRVMAGREEGSSPIVLSPAARNTGAPVDGDLSCARLAIPEVRTPADRPGSDMPPAGLEEPSDSGCTARLRQQTLEALEGWQFYRHLARRARGNAARTLAALAADRHKQARKLSTIYFLLSGVRYWPSEQLAIPAIPSYWGALRQGHRTEQQAEQSYHMAAEEGGDPTLPELYHQLEEGCRERCKKLRELIEAGCP